MTTTLLPLRRADPLAGAALAIVPWSRPVERRRVEKNEVQARLRRIRHDRPVTGHHDPAAHRRPSSAADAVRNAHEWFEVNTGWAPPDEETLAEWIGDGVCRCPDECLVAPDRWCTHGLASWRLILDALAESDGASPR